MKIEDHNLGKDAEKRFSDQFLSDVVYSTLWQDRNEHWDMEGNLNGGRYKFDIKTSPMKDFEDSSYFYGAFFVEGTNKSGEKGFIKGIADYIVYERKSDWCVIDRKKLYQWILRKVYDNGTKFGGDYYQINQRKGYKNKMVMARFDDLPVDIRFFLNK